MSVLRQIFSLGLTFIASAIAAHFATLDYIPKKAMQIVMDRTGQSGTRLNTLIHAPPVTPASRRVVRPSPDLIYSICVYDVSGGPVRVHLAPSETYASLSLYDARTNNFFVESSKMVDEGGVTIEIVNERGRLLNSGDKSRSVVSPTAKGVALIRRIAATPDQLEIARGLRQDDECDLATNHR